MARSTLSRSAPLAGRVLAGGTPFALVSAVAVALALSMAGCAEDFPGAESVPGSEENLEARLLAAQEIGEVGAADKALVKLADDAALVGDSVVTKEALAKVNNAALRDRTASRCALRIAQDGNRTYAVDVALLIGDPVLRDQTMRRLSKALPL